MTATKVSVVSFCYSLQRKVWEMVDTETTEVISASSSIIVKPDQCESDGGKGEATSDVHPLCSSPKKIWDHRESQR